MIVEEKPVKNLFAKQKERDKAEYELNEEEYLLNQMEAERNSNSMMIAFEQSPNDSDS